MEAWVGSRVLLAAPRGARVMSSTVCPVPASAGPELSCASNCTPQLGTEPKSPGATWLPHSQPEPRWPWTLLVYTGIWLHTQGVGRCFCSLAPPHAPCPGRG